MTPSSPRQQNGRCLCGGYWQVFENGTFCKTCDRRKITPLYLMDQPGGGRAKAHGCTCSPLQPDAQRNQFAADKHCPLHGLNIARALMMGVADA